MQPLQQRREPVEIHQPADVPFLNLDAVLDARAFFESQQI